MPADGRPWLYLVEMAKLSLPSVIVATSRRRTCDPSPLTLSRMLSNSSAVFIRTLPMTLADS